MERFGNPMFADLSQEGRKAIAIVPEWPNREQPGRQLSGAGVWTPKREKAIITDIRLRS
jgi:hypothetical protein